MGILEDQAVNIGVNVQDDAIVSTNLNLALIITNEPPQAVIGRRTKEYFLLSDIAVDWGMTSKVYKAAVPHFNQQPHVGSIKIGVIIPKGTINNDVEVSVTSGIATVIKASHGLEEGQEITVSDSSLSPLMNGIKVILTVPTTGTFTFAAAGVPDSSSPGTLDYHTGDATITAGLDAIWGKDTNYFHLLAIYKAKTEIKEIAGWVESKPLIYGVTVEDINNYDPNDLTSLKAELESLGYNNTYLIWYHRAGLDATGVDITVASEISTVTSPGHRLRIGDSFTVSGADKPQLNGDQTVLNIMDVDNFTYSTPGAVDGADNNNGAIKYFARYGFMETAVQARQLGRPEGIGGSSWAYKNYTGFEATPNDILSPSQALNIARVDGSKSGNFYKDLQGSGGRLQYGRMVSGRTIKVQAVALWLKIKCQEAGLQEFISKEQFVYDNASLTQIANSFQVPLGQQFNRQGITPYDTNNNWIIDYPRAIDVPLADKQQNIIRYNIKVRSGNEILSIAVNIAIVQ